MAMCCPGFEDITQGGAIVNRDVLCTSSTDSQPARCLIYIVCIPYYVRTDSAPMLVRQAVIRQTAATQYCVHGCVAHAQYIVVSRLVRTRNIAHPGKY